MDGQTKSTASEVSRDKVLCPDSALVSQFLPVSSKRHRQTEAVNRSRYADIFPQTNFGGLSSDNGFCHDVFTVPLGNDDMEEEEVGMSKQAEFLQGLPLTSLAMKKRDSDIRSPGLNKETLKHITNLLDDDDECFCRDNVQKLIMARHKSKTDYSKRVTVLRKESRISAIQEVDQIFEAGSTQNSG